MLFDTIDFAIFAPIVFLFYWFTSKKKTPQNIIIFLSSLFFYGYWDWRFLSLILLSTGVDYVCGQSVSNKAYNKRKRKCLLILSLFVNLGFLAYFKYCNFFIDSFVNTFQFLGYEIENRQLNIILPVGISFYTFQTLSYTIDCYQQKMKPTKNFLEFASFVTFFPQLVAGPIEKARDLLPQFSVKRVFSYEEACAGMRLILYGLFKKVVIADQAAYYVEMIYGTHTTVTGSTLLLATFLFSTQIYGDFSGYSNIAIGLGKLFGINLSKNFAFPYFSVDLNDFWKRWHISLTSWFRDYIYIPIGGNKEGELMKFRNIMIVFLISGLWHGAGWNFVLWGLLHGIFLYACSHLTPASNSLTTVLRALATFSVTSLLWVLFRASDISQAVEIYNKIFSTELFKKCSINPEKLFYQIAAFFVLELFICNYKRWKFSARIFKITPLRWTGYFFLTIAIMLAKDESAQFIYFQF